MNRHLKQRNEDVYKVFKEVLSVKQGRTLSSDYRLVLQNIGLDFDISIIEDLKRQVKKEGLRSPDDHLGLAVLNSLVALFSDHLLKQRFDKSKSRQKTDGTPCYYELSYEEMFSKQYLPGQVRITPRQYKASVVYFYKNLSKNTIADPLLSIMGNGTSHSSSIKRHAIIRTLTSRRHAVEQLSHAIRMRGKKDKITVHEEAFISIYNKTLVLLLVVGQSDSSLKLDRAIGELG